MRGRLRAAVVTGALVAAGTLTAAPAAHADPLPAPYSGDAHGDILSTELTVTPDLMALVPGLEAEVSATVAHSEAHADSTAATRTSATAANVDGEVLGLVDVPLDQAHAEQPAGPASDSFEVAAVPAAPIADIGVITGDAAANWSGDTSCVTDGPLASSTTELADAQLLPMTTPLGDLTGADVGAATTTSQTALVDQGDGATYSVVSESTANVAAVSLLNGAIQISALDATLTSTATGDPATTQTAYDAQEVTVTVAEGPQAGTHVLNVGDVLDLTVPVLGLAQAQVSLAMPDLTVSDDGLTAAGDVASVLELGITASLGETELLSADLGLLPLGTSATAPEGGVECGILDAPVITSPNDGANTGPTPTYEGTGVPGATVDVVVDGASVGTTTAGDDGSWSLAQPSDLAFTDHTVVATQELDGLESGPSNEVDFSVVPAEPVITSPEDGSSTGPTPAIGGDGQPGAEVEVIIDDETVATVPVGDDGTWAYQPTTPLDEGEHTVDATQTIGDSTQDAEQVSFEVVVVDAPVITSPEDGSSTEDTTPDVVGEGEPGAEVTVTIDGDEVGDTTVDEDGTWTLELTEELECGEREVSAVQTVNGVTSPAAETVVFTIACPTDGGDGDGDGAGDGSGGGAGAGGTSGGVTQGPISPAKSGGVLPATGLSSALVPLALLAMGLIGVGAYALRRGRAHA